ncbi:MAG: leucyl aminopeptidase [Candidatus Heimdallarchaeota archaeon]|nr:leucyl aminopeptidase [Candidatus Heimdallarchaeota archaeon]
MLGNNMNVSTKIEKLEKFDVPIIIVGVLEEAKDDSLIAKDNVALGKTIQEFLELQDFKGKKKESAIIYSPTELATKRLMLVGLGKEKDLSIEDIRNVIGEVSRKVRDLGTKKIAISIDHFLRKDFSLEAVTEAIVQGIIMGSYQNLKYRTKDLDKFKKLDELIIFSSDADPEKLETSANAGKIIAEAVNFCRELSWGPPNYITPSKLAEEAERLAKEYKITTKIFDRAEAKEIGLTSFLAVAQGTEEPPKFIIMEYGAGKKDVETVALIGKAITFDSGGISIKSSSGMEKMKADMTGGAVVIAIMQAIAQLQPNVHLIGIVPATDNMPSGRAYHPADVITSYSGQTIEVISTDAEGRMVINDALTYAAKNYKPKMMFDFATLTGSIYVALGEYATGYFANDEQVAEKLEEASKTSGERIWRMPLWDVYDEKLKSDIADMKHTGGRGGGAIIAARFLSKFVMDVPWAHLDIAGSMGQESNKGYNPKGSKGPCVRLMIDLIRNWK